jgi:hypothetical protein
MCCNLAHGFNTRMNGMRKMAIYEKMLEAWNNRMLMRIGHVCMMTGK